MIEHIIIIAIKMVFLYEVLSFIDSICLLDRIYNRYDITEYFKFGEEIQVSWDSMSSVDIY